MLQFIRLQGVRHRWATGQQEQSTSQFGINSSPQESRPKWRTRSSNSECVLWHGDVLGTSSNLLLTCKNTELFMTRITPQSLHLYGWISWCPRNVTPVWDPASHCPGLYWQLCKLEQILVYILHWQSTNFVFYICTHLFYICNTSPPGSDDKQYAYSAGDQGLIPGSGRSPEEGNGYSLQYSCLEISNTMDGGFWQVTVHEVTNSHTQLSGYHFHFFIHPPNRATVKI